MCNDPIRLSDPSRSGDTGREAGLRLAEFLDRHPRIMILTGAGVSTDSGIPDYRDDQGAWKRKQPVQHQTFMTSHEMRQRYWARSLLGWPTIRNARPNATHHHIVDLGRRCAVSALVTQNVDGLHQKAGSEGVVDLHGRADSVVCMQCGHRCTRDAVHQWSADLNPSFLSLSASSAPDGDADLEVDFSQFSVAGCPRCGGILKPDVVFFGDFVPKTRVLSASEALESSDALLVLGSSLMVYSGFRFCRYARQWSKPIAILNRGRTRADELADLNLRAELSSTLAQALQSL